MQLILLNEKEYYKRPIKQIVFFHIVFFRFYFYIDIEREMRCRCNDLLGRQADAAAKPHAIQQNKPGIRLEM